MHCVISNTIFDVNLLEWTGKQKKTGYCCALHWAWHVSLKWQQLTIITKNGQTHACIMNGETLVTWSSYHRSLIAAILLLLLAHCKFTHQRKWQIVGQWEENIHCGNLVLFKQHVNEGTCLWIYVLLVHHCCLSQFWFCTCQQAVIALTNGTASNADLMCTQMSRVHSTKTHRIRLDNRGRGTG